MLTSTGRFQILFWLLEFLNFEFVSGFEIRYSDLNKDDFYPFTQICNIPRPIFFTP